MADDAVASTERAMVAAGKREQSYRKRDPKDSRGMADMAHDDMQKLAGSTNRQKRARTKSSGKKR